ncbi:hypothetical protein AQ490_13835 [Wenjunlia vitaminophila]|uniref:DUF11 domain-containing protein n=1 Tax=Wenjunlia vitaminophila TaxID=76728 RepID=A0A0T6LXG5_WENVI|nr:DUF11 domain-containing protein [Wenjunlia vitaminophila]KRV50710.1 hypothetical protein AQ490_13835 [Wenjunlia vitaminophila]
MNGGTGPSGWARSVRIVIAVVVLLSSVVALGELPVARPAGPDLPAPAPAADPVRVTYAGTEHHSMGLVTGVGTSDPFFGPAPTHFDTESFARGDALVFTSLRDSRRPQVYLRTAAGTVHRLTTDRNAAHPQLTPDGQWVVFDSAEPGGPEGKEQRDLWIVRVDGTGERRLTDTPADERYPTVSPDGSRLAYSSNDACTCRDQIYVRALAGGPVTQVTSATEGSAVDPVWNPVDDAAHRDLIAYTLEAEGETGPSLRVTTPAGEDAPLLTAGGASWRSRSADWLPNGDEVVFVGLDGPYGATGRYVYRSATGSASAPSLVLDESGRDVSSPTWLGPGDTGGVVVTRTSAATPHVARLSDIRPDGVDPRDLGLDLLVEDPAADTNTDPANDPLFHPAPGYDPWTERQGYGPDGRQIVVSRFEGPPGDREQRIWLADAEGRDPRVVGLHGRERGDWDTDPAFSPDGRFLAFTRTSPGGAGPGSGPGRVLIALVATGEVVGTVRPPRGWEGASDAQPTWSSDGAVIAFTRTAVINDNGGNKHVWTVPADSLDEQADLSATLCPGSCEVIDDSPAFSPDGRTLAFNRKDGGGRTNERNGVLVTPLTGGGCRVVLPAGLRDRPDACWQALPDTSRTGPHQPRDVAWSPDGSRLVLSSREGVEPNAPEALSVLDVATGDLTDLTASLPGRQKEPAYQQSVDLALTAPETTPAVRTGSVATVTVTVTNAGPAPSPGTVFTAAPPAGVRLEGLTTPAGGCDTAALQCDLGVLPPLATVRVTARVVGVTEGDQTVGWSVSGAVVDPDPGDNAGRTVVPVEQPPPQVPRPPTSDSPPTSDGPPGGPSAPAPPPQHPQPPAGPALSLDAQPNPGYVGGRVVLSYTVRNRGEALASGLRLRLGLPAGVPTGRLPAGCTRTGCVLGDLEPGASSVVRVVLAPREPLRTTLTGTLTTTGTDANRADNTAREPLRVLQPRIVAVPAVGKPGFVTSVRGTDFPPGAPVTLTWKPGITAAAAPTLPRRDGTFAAQLLIMTKDQTGPRTITARGPGFSPVTTPFLVVNGTFQPPDEVTRR